MIVLSEMTRYNSIRSGGECYGCIEERRGLYKTNSKYSEMALEIRNSVGELTANGKEKIKGYTNNLIDQTIEKNINEANIEKMTPDEKKRYTAVLEAKGIPVERIQRYGFAFEGKRVLIGKG